MALVVAYQAKRITAIQAEVSLRAVMPQFVLIAQQIKSEVTADYEDDQLTVTNSGGIVRELDCEAAVFLKVELFYRDPSKGEPIRTMLPVNGYYSGCLYNPQGSGQVVTLVGHKNYKRALSLQRELGSLAEAQGMIGFCELVRCVKLRYVDILGKGHLDYYDVPLIFGGRKLTASEGEACFRAYSRGERARTSLDFDGITAEAVLSAAMAPLK